ncbi:hypothetical protein LTR47_002205 [Exophiala xenobiotica]|nr:hypothetical protein LTR72_005645 [Exophiala xenobiotica]KAK5237027.1 hypothetical protein LTR47_002205 [Exophiala xenobiotica]KAK5247283.1 hypothetical protein LTS06_007555 [Exophiala xenobiotica]KAK5297373.1 hypothetical protein LTR14_003104 [Exophiala xenobiotica]KAK5328596.1 hypothetical protein LTR93_002381 [Exophiala xenobiotica]
MPSDSLSIFDRQQKHRGSTFLCCYRQASPKEFRYKDRAGASLSSSRSAYEFDKDDHRLYLVPENRSPSRFEREQWLQRRNSLSSQRAIYPHKYYYHDPRSRYIPANSYAPSSRYSSTLRSVSEGACLDLSDRSSSLSSSQSSGSLARMSRPSTMASQARYRSSSNPEKPGHTVHAGSLTATSTVPNMPPLPAVPPPAWCPSLQHTPLSADPSIRALSTGVVLPSSRSTPALALLSPSPPRDTKDRAAVAPKAVTVVAACPKVPLSKDSATRERDQMPSSGAPLPPAHQPMPTMPPPPPPTTQPASQPPTAAAVASSPSAWVPAMPAPPIPARSPGHHVFPHSTRSTSSSASVSTGTGTGTGTSRPSLRRPSPIRDRYRQHPHPSPYQYNQYQYQRVGRDRGARDANPSVSMYSASSYGTTDRSVNGAGAGAGPGPGIAATAKVGGRK